MHRLFTTFSTTRTVESLSWRLYLSETLRPEVGL